MTEILPSPRQCSLENLEMPTSATSVTPELVREQVAKILAWPRFAAAGRLQSFLKYTTEKSLAGQAADIKEYLVAIEVYGRKPDYDPKIDSIVRVEASRLRSRLHDYYADAGRLDPVVIDFPKGTYAPVFHLRAQPAVETPSIPIPIPHQAGSRWLTIALAAALTLITGGYSWKVAAKGHNRPSIAVAPFNNLSLNPANDNFARGLAKDIESALTQTAKLQVLSAAAPNKSHADLSLEGSIRMEGDRVRVVAQILSTRDGGYVWSRTFDRDFREPAGVQTQLAAAIAGMVDTLAANYAIEESQTGSARSKAMELYRLARIGPTKTSDSFHHRGVKTLERLSFTELQKSISLLQQSIATDPSFAAAYASLASFYQVAAEYDVRMVDKAKDTAHRALELDPNLGEAHATLAYMHYFFDWDFPAAAVEFRKALQLEPLLLSAYRLYADAQSILGHPEQGLQELERGRVVYPHDPVIETSYAVTLFHAGRYKEMENHARTVVARSPEFPLAHWALGLALEQQRRYPEAIAELETCLRLSPHDGRCFVAIGHAYALAGRRQDALRILADLSNRPSSQLPAPYSLALIQNALGDREKAFANLEISARQKEAGFPYLRVEPRFANLRSDPRYNALLSKVSL